MVREFFFICPMIIGSFTYFSDFEKETQYALPTYLLTPWGRVFLEKLTGLQLVKKFPALYGTQRFITVFTSARHLSLSWANSIQSPTPPTSRRSRNTHYSTNFRTDILFVEETKKRNSNVRYQVDKQMSGVVMWCAGLVIFAKPSERILLLFITKLNSKRKKKA